MNNNRDLQAVKAGLWYIVSNFIIKCIGILTMPIVVRMMTKEEFGEVATFTSWHSMLAVFFSLNLSFSVGRAKLDYQEKLDNYIGASQILCALFSFCLIIIIFLFFDYFSDLLGLKKLFLGLLLLYLFFEPAVEFFTNGCRYRYRYKQSIAIAMFVAIMCPTISLTLMYLYPDSRALCRIIGIISPTIIVSIFLWLKSFREKNFCWNLEYWKYGLSLSLPLLLHTLSIHLLGQSDRIFISKLCGNEYVGLYSLVYSYGVILTTISLTINQGWLPWFHDAFFASNFNAIRKNVKPLVILACFIALACVAFAPEAIYLLGGKKYAESIHCVLPVVLGVLCQFIYGHYVNIELHKKKTKYVSYGSSIAAIINIILNAIFIPKYGYIAAAYTTFASCLILMIIHYVFTRVLLNVNLYNNRFMFASISITSIIATFVQSTFDNNLLRFTITSIGFITFLYIFRNYFGFIRNLIKQKFVRQ